MKQIYFFSLLLLLFSACAVAPKSNSNMQVYAIRLEPGQDLRKEIEAFSKTKNLNAGFILSCAGSLQVASIRPANQPGPMTIERKFEIVSLSGTLSPDGPHLHIALSDSTGQTIGGHLLEGCIIYTTAEIVIGNAEHLTFKRETDPKTTYKELKVYENKQ